MEAETHTKEWCFCNPQSKMYKAEVHERRVNLAKTQGIKVPKKLMPAAKKGGNANIIGQLQEIVAQVSSEPDIEE